MMKNVEYTVCKKHCKGLLKILHVIKMPKVIDIFIDVQAIFNESDNWKNGKYVNGDVSRKCLKFGNSLIIS